MSTVITVNSFLLCQLGLYFEQFLARDSARAVTAAAQFPVTLANTSGASARIPPE